MGLDQAAKWLRRVRAPRYRVWERLYFFFGEGGASEGRSATAARRDGARHDDKVACDKPTNVAARGRGDDAATTRRRRGDDAARSRRRSAVEARRAIEAPTGRVTKTRQARTELRCAAMLPRRMRARATSVPNVDRVRKRAVRKAGARPRRRWCVDPPRRRGRQRRHPCGFQGRAEAALFNLNVEAAKLLRARAGQRPSFRTRASAPRGMV